MTIYDPISEALGVDPIDIESENVSDYIYEEFNDKIIPWNVGIPDTEEAKALKSKKMKSYWTEDRRNKKSKDMIEYNKIHGTERYSKALLEKYINPEFKEKFTHKMNSVNKCPEKRKKASKKLKDKWNDPEYVAKMKNRGGGSKKVQVSVDGTLYDSLSEAVSETGLSYHTIRKMAGLIK